MMLTRQAARFAKGWDRDQVQAAGEQAADALAGAVQPFARPLIEEHRGRRARRSSSPPPRPTT